MHTVSQPIPMPIYRAHPPHGIIPDHLIEKVVVHFESKGLDHIASRINDQRANQLQELTNRIERQQSAFHMHRKGIGVLPDGQVIKVYSSNNGKKLQRSKDLKRSDAKISRDKTVNEAYDGAEATYTFLKKNYNLNSIDGHGFHLISNVHFDHHYCNAYWNGEQMVYGDGDGKVFDRFTKDIDISAHEQCHGMTQDNAGSIVSSDGKATGIDYEGEAGGINEGYSDIFGIMVKQFKAAEQARNSNWLIGETLLIPKKGKSYALRSMLNPGTAFVDHPALGTDTQVDHYAEYLSKAKIAPVDPHDSSGIVNKAFALAAITLGDNSWDVAGHIFFDTLPYIIPNETFEGLAAKTLSVAKTKYKSIPAAQDALIKGWRAVGVMS